MTKPKILIVDDDETIRSQMRWALSRDYEVAEAGDRLSALKIMDSEQPFVVLLDLGLPPKPRDATEGLQALSEIIGKDSTIKVIMVTGNTERGNERAVGKERMVSTSRISTVDTSRPSLLSRLARIRPSSVLV